MLQKEDVKSFSIRAAAIAATLPALAVDPEFANNQLIYPSYSEEAPSSAKGDTADPRFGGFLDLTDNRLIGGAVMRARLDGNRLADGKVIWRQEPKTIARGHFGHRLVFGRDGTLFITSGDQLWLARREQRRQLRQVPHPRP
jgi:glucose/arabinose dehydrogenase